MGLSNIAPVVWVDIESFGAGSDPIGYAKNWSQHVIDGGAS